MLGHFSNGVMERLGLKAPWNYSVPFWSYNFSICLWENQKTFISMISDFWMWPGLPKPIIFVIGDTRIPTKSQEAGTSSNIVFLQISKFWKFLFCRFGKRRAPTNREYLSFESLKVLDMRSIYLSKDMKWQFSEFLKLWNQTSKNQEPKQTRNINRRNKNNKTPRNQETKNTPPTPQHTDCHPCTRPPLSGDTRELRGHELVLYTSKFTPQLVPNFLVIGTGLICSDFSAKYI